MTSTNALAILRCDARAVRVRACRAARSFAEARARVHVATYFGAWSRVAVLVAASCPSVTRALPCAEAAWTAGTAIRTAVKEMPASCFGGFVARRAAERLGDAHVYCSLLA